MIRLLAGWVAVFAVALGLAVADSAHANIASWGFNEHGELCAGYLGAPEPPVPTVTPAGTQRVVAAEANLFFLTSTGSLYACGGNGIGLEGIGKQTLGTTTPVLTHVPAPVVSVAAHGWDALAATGDGRVWTWGSDARGSIGNGITTEGREVKGFFYPIPAPVAGIEHATAVFAGGPDDFAVLADGEVLGWGGNNGQEIAPGGEVLRPTVIPAFHGAIQVAAGGFIRRGGDAYALLPNGTVLARGRNELGQLGAPSPGVVPLPGPAVDVAASVNTAYAILANGDLYAWGNDAQGQAGVGVFSETCRVNATTTAACVRVPRRVLTGVSGVCGGQSYTAAVSGGRVYEWGTGEHGDMVDLTAGTAPASVAPELAGVTAVDCGRFHPVASYGGPAIPPILEGAPTVNGVRLAWRSKTVTAKWNLQWRVRKPGVPFGAITTLPVTARSFTVTGLAVGVEYELVVKNLQWGRRAVTGTPLSALARRRSPGRVRPRR